MDIKWFFQNKQSLDGRIFFFMAQGMTAATVSTVS